MVVRFPPMPLTPLLHCVPGVLPVAEHTNSSEAQSTAMLRTQGGSSRVL